jgi:hypothetical protein
MLGSCIRAEASARILLVPHLHTNLPHRHHVGKCRGIMFVSVEFHADKSDIMSVSVVTSCR